MITAAFTLSTSYGENTVQQNAQKTWCYYPAAGQTRDTSCAGDFTLVSRVHLNTTISIGYYAPDNTRYGGAEWPVPLTNPGKVTLCVSGRAQDGTYQTACMFVNADNSLPIGSGCWIAVAQSTVTDRCYEPGQPAYTITSSLSTIPTVTKSLAHRLGRFARGLFLLVQTSFRFTNRHVPGCHYGSRHLDDNYWSDGEIL